MHSNWGGVVCSHHEVEVHQGPEAARPGQHRPLAHAG